MAEEIASGELWAVIQPFLSASPRPEGPTVGFPSRRLCLDLPDVHPNRAL